MEQTSFPPNQALIHSPFHYVELKIAKNEFENLLIFGPSKSVRVDLNASFGATMNTYTHTHISLTSYVR